MDCLSRLVRYGVLLPLCLSGTVTVVHASDADQNSAGTLVPKATCGPGDNPETGLQGQVPAALRAAGFKGFNCNLKLIGQSKNDGGNWQTAEFKDKRQIEGVDSEQTEGRTLHTCGYYGSASPTASPKTGMKKSSPNSELKMIADQLDAWCIPR